MLDFINAILEMAGLTIFFGIAVTFYTLVIAAQVARHIHENGCGHCKQERVEDALQGRARIRLTEAQRN